jgi:hypothetical protein
MLLNVSLRGNTKLVRENAALTLSRKLLALFHERVFTAMDPYNVGIFRIPLVP